MSKVHVVNHPLVQHKLTLMRQKDCGTKDFRQLLEEISHQQRKGKHDNVAKDISFGHIHIPLFAEGKCFGLRAHFTGPCFLCR